ncbi:hypothetical protein [Sphingopyxis granuli]|nr:hypothetical protein [Sphingopyxis granuli]
MLGWQHIAEAIGILATIVVVLAAAGSIVANEMRKRDGGDGR